MRSSKQTPFETEQGQAELETALLMALCRPSAFIRADGNGAVLYAKSRGVTLAAGHPSLSLIERLVATGALKTEHAAASMRYTISAAGRAQLETGVKAENSFAAQHGEYEMLALDGDGDVVVRNAGESPLLWLYRRGGGLVGDAEFAAGERLRADMTIARTLPRLTADLERPSRSGVAIGLDPSEARVAATQRVQKALKAVGPELAGVLVDVCGFLKGLDVVERERGWPQRSAKLVLSLALSALARHYGLGVAAIGVRGKRKHHRWSASSERPAFVARAAEGAAG